MSKHFKNFVILLISSAALLFLVSCQTLSPTKGSVMNIVTTASSDIIIPVPVSLVQKKGFFNLNRETKIYYPSSNLDNDFTARYLQHHIKSITGYDLQILSTENFYEKGNIYLILQNEIANSNPERYELSITENSINIISDNSEGLFRGVQTFIQMLFPLKNKIDLAANYIQIPNVEIKDYPRFQWRGVMLDVARHFFGVNDVKKLIDLIALYKFNRLHLHLTDDQGWRIQINSWPKLTEIGGSTQVGGGAGGFYTQKEFAEIVEYAKKRFITIVPEIDLPGHTNAALASYPELNCDGVAPELYTGIKVGFSSLCIDKEITYDFIKDVIREVAELTPGSYIHIGGDEAHATDSVKYMKFMERVQEIVNSNNKKMIGWEEITQSKLNPTSIVHYWRKADYVLAGIKQGNKVIMSPSSKVYMDMKYNPNTELGLNWAGYIEVSDSYNWDPSTQINGLNEKDILGVEAPLWTETILNFSDIECMLFPRLPGVAEIGWSPNEKRIWDEYKIRLSNHGKYWEKIGLNFYKSPQINWE